MRKALFQFPTLLLMLLAAPLQAGPIFVPGHLDEGKFVPEAVTTPCYSVRYSTGTVTVEENTARVRIEEILEGQEKEIEALGIVPMPEGAEGTAIRVTLGAVGAEPTTILADSRYLTPAKAQEVYQAVAKATGKTNLLAFSGRPAILIPRARLKGKAQLTVSFQTPVRHTEGVSSLSCPMPAAGWTRGPVERMALTVNLKTKEPLRTVFSPTHEATITRKGLTEASATVRADHWSGLDDFRLFWVADKDDLGLRVLAYRGQGKEDGYFMLLGNPTGSAAEKVVDKDVVFVLDTSGSMRGEKIEQARSAIDYCLEHLNKGDRFNIITFGTAVSSFRDDLVPLNPGNLAASREFVENVVANGRTNIGGALAKALAGKAGEGRPRIMIFVTDGAPTAGEIVPDKILEQVKKANQGGTKVFVMGVGNDVNAHLLDQIAEVTDGSSEYVAPREELDAKIASLYDRLSHPVLAGVKVSFGELATQAVLPPRLPVLFKGSEIMMVGRYKEGGKHTFTISGDLSGKRTQYKVTVDLPAKASDTGNEFLAPLWAARQIGYLLQEIRLHGENKELMAEVVRLSKQYGIVTEYTAFIAMDTAKGARGGFMNKPAEKDIALKEAESRIAAGRAEKAGQWAVTQAANARSLQNRSVASNEANAYRDRRGNLTKQQNVTQISSRAFYLQDGQWADAEEAGTRKLRVIKLFSPEYFELLKKDPTFAKAQQLGWALSINVGEERIVIEKDGKQKDETLQKQAQSEEDSAPRGGANVGPSQLQNRRSGLKQQEKE